MKKDKDYEELRITTIHRATDFHLVDLGKEIDDHELENYPELNFDHCYDIKVSPKQIFEGCGVFYNTHYYQGMGGMSESSSESTGFFETDGLTIKLESGFLMKINEEATQKKQKEKMKEEKEEKLKELRQEKKEINEKIKKYREIT